jgi:hypothetical protein
MREKLSKSGNRGCGFAPKKKKFGLEHKRRRTFSKELKLLNYRKNAKRLQTSRRHPKRI